MGGSHLRTSEPERPQRLADAEDDFTAHRVVPKQFGDIPWQLRTPDMAQSQINRAVYYLFGVFRLFRWYRLFCLSSRRHDPDRLLQGRFFTARPAWDRTP